MAENSEKTAKKPRGRPFKKGESGNPGGRPKLPKEFIERAREKSFEALEYLIETVGNKDVADTVRVRAAETIIAYGFGKPTQAIDLSSNDKSFEITVKYE